MSAWVRVFAPAKINLTLHVTGQRDDGYHLINSLVAFTDFGDELRLRPSSQMSLKVTGPMAEGVPSDARNLVWKAASWFGTPPVDIELIKHLPAAAGIGGGSSDAATTLRALSALFNAPLPPLVDVAELGADIPVCLHARTCEMSGIGEVITPLHKLPETHILLINPGVEVPTPAVFKALTSKANSDMPRPLPEFKSSAQLIDWLSTCRNDLEDPAISICTEIQLVLGALRSAGLPFARMSGSGATCFALSSDGEAIRRAEREISAAKPNWWVKSGRLQ